MPPAHPSAEQLQRFATNQASETELAWIEPHLLGCASCRSRLESWWNPKVVRLLRQIGTDSGEPPADVVEWVAQLKRCRPTRPTGAQGEQSVHGVASGDSPSRRTEQPALLAARFKLLRLHAVGGLGRVSVAEDCDFGRSVALKQLRTERADDGPSRRRFVNEAEITGWLEHRGIAPIYAKGVDGEGRPFYAMKFVHGQPLNEAIGDYHAASTPARLRSLLERFVDVCRTIGYAHDRGVIHRDLKPENILLGEYGETIVLDWGLAKRLDRPLADDAADAVCVGLTPATGTDAATVATAKDQTPNVAGALTAAGQILGTPAYMSPEQATGDLESVGPRSDIFGLGAVLYCLLTNQAPYAAPGTVDATRMARRATPPRARVVNRSVPPSLDAICARAMAPEPADRYATALELAVDVARWLADEPVLARPEPWPVRSARWLRKHRTLASAAAISAALFLVAALAFVGLVSRHNATLYDANVRLADANAALRETNRREQAALEEADSRRRQAEQAQQREAEARRASDGLLRYVLDVLRSPDPARDGRAVTIAERLAAAVLQVDRDLAGEPQMQGAVFDAIGQTYYGLGLPREAVRVHRLGYQLRRQHLGDQSVGTLESANNLAAAQLAAGQVQDAVQLLEQTLAARRRVSGTAHPETLNVAANLAAAYQTAGDLQSAGALLEEVLAQRRQLSGADQTETVVVMHNLAALYRADGRLDQAVPLFEEAAKRGRSLLADSHPTRLEIESNLAAAYTDIGKAVDAVPLLQHVIAVQQARLGAEHPDVLLSLHHLALAYQSAGQVKQAVATLRRVIAVKETALGADHPETLASRGSLAAAYLHAGQRLEALKLLESLLPVMQAKLGHEHPNTLGAVNNLAAAHLELGRPLEAAPLLEQLVEAQRRQLGADHPATLTSLSNLAVAYRAAGQNERALPLVRQTHELRKQKLGAGHPSTLTALDNLAVMLHTAGQTAEAIERARQALAARTKVLGPQHPATLQSLSTLAVLYQKSDQTQRALPLLKDVLAGRRALLGNEHPTTIQAMINYGGTCYYAGQFEVAERLLREALALLEKQSPDHWRTGHVRCWLGAALCGLKRFPAAESALLEGFATLERQADSIPATQQDILGKAANWVAQLYYDWDKPQEASRWRGKADAFGAANSSD